MNRPAKIVSRDGLDKFISSFNKFANREDLVDTDSESDSVDENATRARSSVTHVVANQKDELEVDGAALHSIHSLCIPQLENALFEAPGDKKTDSIEVRSSHSAPNRGITTK